LLLGLAEAVRWCPGPVRKKLLVCRDESRRRRSIVRELGIVLAEQVFAEIAVLEVAPYRVGVVAVRIHVFDEERGALDTVVVGKGGGCALPSHVAWRASEAGRGLWRVGGAGAADPRKLDLVEVACHVVRAPCRDLIWHAGEIRVDERFQQ